MTTDVRLLSTYKGFPPQSIISLPDAEATSLVSVSHASLTLTGGTRRYQDLAPLSSAAVYAPVGTQTVQQNQRFTITVPEGFALHTAGEDAKATIIRTSDSQAFAVGIVAPTSGAQTYEISCTAGTVSVWAVDGGAGAARKNANSAASIIPLGDSVTAGTYAAATGVTLSRVAGVVTATHNGHPYMTGQYALIEQMGDSSFNGFVRVTRTGANTYTYVNPGPDGSTSGGYVRNPYWIADNGWFSWARMALKNRLNVLYMAGVGGDKTTDILARMQSDVVAKSPTWCSVMAGLNDVINTNSPLTAAQIFANIQTIYAKLRAAGIGIIAMTVTPLATGHAQYSAANQQKIMDINAAIRREVRNNPGMVLVDAFAAVVDPLSATAQPLSGYVSSTDYIHPTAKGSKAIADAFVAVMSSIIPLANTLPSSAADNRTVNAANSNLWPSLPSTTTGGTLAGTASGTPPDGFKVMSVAGSPTVVASGVARTMANDGDTLGTNCRMVFTPAAANDIARITQEASGWAATAAVGKAYYLECAINVTGVAGSNLSQLFASVTFTVDGVQYPAYVMQPSNTTFPTSDFSGVIQSIPFFLTGTTATNIVITLDAKASAAGTAVTVDMGRVQVRELPAGSTLSA